MVLLFVALMADVSMAQVTNGTGGTNVTTLPPFDPGSYAFGKEAIWLAAIPVFTFLVTWFIGKIPAVPPRILTLIVPFVGIGIGKLFQLAEQGQWGWWWSAGAGMVATWIYQGIKDASENQPAIQKVILPTDPNDKLVNPIPNP